MGNFKTKKPNTGFTRPVANGSQNINREWKTIPAKDVQEGDIIAGMGIVKMTFEACDSTQYIEAGETTEIFLDLDTEVFAFVKKED